MKKEDIKTLYYLLELFEGIICQQNDDCEGCPLGFWDDMGEPTCASRETLKVIEENMGAEDNVTD